MAIHIGEHIDIHAHVHAHDSHDEPLHGDRDQHGDDHRHEVKKASDIIGTLTIQTRVLTNELTTKIFAPVVSSKLVVQNPTEIPYLFDLPPPRPVPTKYHLSSFSHRGPPIA
ncbi:MAG: hypothetical protein R3222_01425 [Balneolaceae bacterium]|nr:hypothetical protein [Balneolaceae bacterium]